MVYTIKILSQNGQTHTAINIGSVISAKVTKKINSADHFIMKWSGEGLESDLQAFNNGIMVEDATGHVIFGGRIVSINRDIYGFYEIESEGALAYLNDYVVAPFELTKANGWSPSTLNRAVYTYVSQAYDHVASRGVDNTWSVLEMLPQYCNGANPELLVGEVSTDYMTCYEMLKNLVVDIAGNYLEVVYTKSGDEFVPKLYVKSTLNRESTQTLNLGSNIMDFNMSNDYTDICTRVFVFGARKKDSDKRYSLLDAGRSTKYLNADADVVNRYGVIAKSLIYDKVKNPARLLKIAENYLKKHDRPHTVISLTAIDLSLINSSIDNFRLGDLVQVNVATSNFNAKVQVKAIEYDLINVQNSKITCESEKKTQSNWLKSNIDLLEGLNSYTSWDGLKNYESIKDTTINVINSGDVTTSGDTASVVFNVIDVETGQPIVNPVTINASKIANPQDIDNGSYVLKVNDSYYLVENETLTEEQLEAIEGAELVKETLGTKLVVGSIEADKIDVDDLFAQDITATGTITGATLKGGELTTTSTETPTGRIIDNELTIKDGELHNKVDIKRTDGVIQHTDETWINKSGLLLKSKMFYAHGEPTENALGISTTDTGASISSIKDLAIGTDGQLFLRGTPIAFNGTPLNELFVQEMVSSQDTLGTLTINAGATSVQNFSIEKEGYIPISLNGYWITGTAGYGNCTLYRFQLAPNESKVYFNIKNQGSTNATGILVRAYVGYLKQI